MKLRINFGLKAGVTGEIPVLAIMTSGQKEIDLITGKTTYKRLRYYTSLELGLLTTKPFEQTFCQLLHLHYLQPKFKRCD